MFDLTLNCPLHTGFTVFSLVTADAFFPSAAFNLLGPFLQHWPLQQLFRGHFWPSIRFFWLNWNCSSSVGRCLLWVKEMIWLYHSDTSTKLLMERLFALLFACMVPYYITIKFIYIRGISSPIKNFVFFFITSTKVVFPNKTQAALTSSGRFSWYCSEKGVPPWETNKFTKNVKRDTTLSNINRLFKPNCDV